MPILLQINVTSNWGSTGKIAEQIGLCAMKHGWKSFIAFGRMSNPSKSNVVKIGSKLDTYIHYIGSRFFDSEGLVSRIATRLFLKKIEDIQPDIVHLHNIHDHYLNYPILFKYLAEKKIPVVWTQHDQWPITGHCMYIPEECSRWKEECHNCYYRNFFSLDKSLRNHKLKKSLIAAIPQIIIVPVSQWLGEYFKTSFLKNRDIRVVHNGIDINVFSPKNVDIYKRYGINKNKKIVLGVAAVWSERKGLDDFYRLAQHLSKDDYVIIIVGYVPEKSKSITNGCQFIFIKSTQDANELAELYSAASVFVNPTYQDNYPTTILESIACGTPVVTYRTGGCPEAVDTTTGFVVSQGDIEALKKAIEKLASNNCQHACRQKAISFFDKDKCFEEYIKIYNDLLSMR